MAALRLGQRADVGGRRDKMLAAIQEKYGDSKEVAEAKLAALESRFR